MKYQVAIIGGGPAGYTAAERAGKAGLSVVLFEKNSVGGVCLNEGCIPTKTLLYASKLYDSCVHARKYNVSAGEVSFDLPKMIARKSKVVRKLVLGVKAKLTGANVTLVNGEAFIVDAHTVRCAGEIYECENLILCTGGQTVIPPIPGIEKVGYWTHRDALDNKEIPRSLAIIGGGVIGMEFASFFSDLGVKVTVIEMMDEILNGIDREIASMLRADYAKRGVDFKLGAKVVRLEQNETGMQVYYQSDRSRRDLFRGRKIALECRETSGDARLRVGKLVSCIYRTEVHQGKCPASNFCAGCICLRRFEWSLSLGSYGGKRSRNSGRYHLGKICRNELSCHSRRGLYTSRGRFSGKN